MARKSLHQRLAQAKVDLDVAKARYDELAEIARERFEYGSHSDGDVTINVQVNRRWNKQRAFAAFGDKICTLQPDQKVAKDVMTGSEYDSFYDEGSPKIIVKFA